MDETPLIQQYLQFRSEFMGYLYAMTRDAEMSEEVYQNAAVVVMEQSQKSETIRNFRCVGERSDSTASSARYSRKGRFGKTRSSDLARASGCRVGHVSEGPILKALLSATKPGLSIDGLGRSARRQTRADRHAIRRKLNFR